MSAQGTTNLSNLIQFEQEQVQVGTSGERYRTGSVTDKNVANTKLILGAVFGSVPNDFQEKILETGPEYNFMIFYNEFPVGMISCKPDSATKTLHITSICVLKPYRNVGLGTKLIEKCKQIASEKKLKNIQIDTSNALQKEGLTSFLTKLSFISQNETPHILVFEAAK